MKAIQIAWRWMRCGIIIAIVLFVWLGSSQWSYSYDEDGHFYTAVALQHFRQPPFDGILRNQAALLAFCAQLPDLAKEFDAVTLRVGVMSSLSGWAWGPFSYCGSDNDVCHMVTAHHYLHGLTDTDAEPVTEAAVATLRALLRPAKNPSLFDPNRVCAAGFAVHLLADSFAHRRLRSPNQMYAPGLGHYRDDHNPDFVLYNKDGNTRVNLWLRLVENLSNALSVSLDKSRWDVLAGILKTNLTGAKPENRFNEAGMIADLRATLKAAMDDQTRDWAPYNPPVEKLTEKDGWWGRHVLQYSCPQVLNKYLPPDGKSLDCARIWNIYITAAIPEFANRKIPAVCPPK